jgi:exportin-T
MALSPGNKAGFEPMLESMQGLAENFSDPSGQKAAFIFLGRCVSVWGQPGLAQGAPNGDGSHGLPGFERFVYERLVPAAFRVLSSPQCNIKDPQILTVSIVPFR